MKSLFSFLLGLVTLAMVGRVVNGIECAYDEAGICLYECPEGTHSYTTGCGPKTPEPTCDEPNPVQEEGDICDYSDCYCNSPTVRDTVSNKCVTIDKCPKKEEQKKETEKEGKI